MSNSILDCWALLLNENQKYLKDGPQKLYVGSSISVTIVEAASSDGNSQLMDNVYQGLEEWMKIAYNDFDLSEVELSDMISTFFDQRLTQSGGMVNYAMEFPTLNWRSSKDNSDSGVYIIMSMLLFNGADAFKCEILKTASNRKILRIQIAASLVLSDMNEARSVIIDKVAEFKPDRQRLSKEVEERRKKEIR
ncbi:uncharacterized protein LOC110694258 [Chenopodium quinoa]|uniref:uncharacterized protein LOC110694258 n=1 Tax=Chenopodium quinoa TaxID=63459 RepID=UPI000B788D9D|nr:uncharacterized protein LOC110694258 [Chenopodium quinoa]